MEDRRAASWRSRRRSARNAPSDHLSRTGRHEDAGGTRDAPRRSTSRPTSSTPSTTTSSDASELGQQVAERHLGAASAGGLRVHDDALRRPSARSHRPRVQDPIASSPLRILCITDEYPWPATSGYRTPDRQRHPRSRTRPAPSICSAPLQSGPTCRRATQRRPPGIARLFVHHRPLASLHARPALVRWLSPVSPERSPGSTGTAPTTPLEAWAEEDYDVVWFSHCHTWLALAGRDRGPAIVDFDNLEDEKLRTLIELRRLQRQESGGRPPARTTVAAQLDRIDLGRWRRAQRRAAAAARAVVVCSALDRDGVSALTRP